MKPKPPIKNYYPEVLRHRFLDSFVFLTFWVLVTLLLPFFFFEGKIFAGEKTLTLVLAGDVMLGRLVDKKLSSSSSSYVWGNTLSVLKNADLTIVNQEFALTQSNKKWGENSKAFHFRAKPKTVQTLKAAGIDYVSLANNHILDFGIPGLKDTLRILDKNNIAHAGAGMDRNQAQKVALLEKKGIQVAVISISDNVPAWEATTTQPGIFHLTISESNIGAIRKKVLEAKNQGADLVILSAHWGENWVNRPSPAFKGFAHAAINAGVDIIHGHSGHSVQGIESYKGKPIFYNMGDLIDDYAIKQGYRNDLAFIARLEISVNPFEVKKIELTPTHISQLRVNLATGDDFETLFNRVRTLSQKMGTKIIENHGKLEVKIP